jgi:hypothetical protein
MGYLLADFGEGIDQVCACGNLVFNAIDIDGD